MMGNVWNAGHDENGGIAGATLGDNTGTECRIMPLFDFGQKYILRFDTPAFVNTLSRYAYACAANDMVGYSQTYRETLWNALKTCDKYNPAFVQVPCACDCSSGTTALVKAAGYVCGIDSIANIAADTYTGNLKDRYTAAGFTCIAYSASALKQGDVCLAPAYHVNIYLGDYTPTPTPTLDCDGYWGTLTTSALETSYGLDSTGKVLGQYSGNKARLKAATSGWEWLTSNPTGCKLISLIQGTIGVEQDGIIGVNTIKALEAWYGYEQDGVLDAPSLTVKAMQMALNGRGTL